MHLPNANSTRPRRAFELDKLDACVGIGARAAGSLTTRT
jgi:hypothetical protein